MQCFALVDLCPESLVRLQLSAQSPAPLCIDTLSDKVEEHDCQEKHNATTQGCKIFFPLCVVLLHLHLADAHSMRCLGLPRLELNHVGSDGQISRVNVLAQELGELFLDEADSFCTPRGHAISPRKRARSHLSHRAVRIRCWSPPLPASTSSLPSPEALKGTKR